jgi:hypothetical protein
MTVNFSAVSSMRKHQRSGTSTTIHGGASSTMSLNRLAVLLDGTPGNTAPRRMMTDRNLYVFCSVPSDTI